MHMRDTGVIVLIIIGAVAIGGLLYLFGGAAFHAPARDTKGSASGMFTILAQGTNAAGIDQAVNYSIDDADQLDALWQIVYGNTGVTPPAVDFSKEEVLAVFGGSHSASGYGVRVNSVSEKDGQSIIDITYTEPDTSCTPQGGATSPFVIVKAKKTSLTLTHVEHTEVTPCS